MLTSDSSADPFFGSIGKYLNDRFPGISPVMPDTLLLEGAIDSLGFLDLLMFLSEEFGIAIDDENFDFQVMETPQTIADFARRMTA